MAGGAAPGGDSGLVAVDLDATIVVAHSEKAARLALAQLPRRLRGRVLIRADSGGGTQ